MISTHKGCLFRDIEAGTLIRTGACFHFSCDWRGFARKKNDFQFHLWRRRRRGWCSNPPKYSPGKSAGDWPRGCIDFVISSSLVCSWCSFLLQLPILPIPMLKKRQRGVSLHEKKTQDDSSTQMKGLRDLNFLGHFSLNSNSPVVWNVSRIKINYELVVPIETNPHSVLSFI